VHLLECPLHRFKATVDNRPPQQAS
jgi:hypothetical protein